MRRHWIIAGMLLVGAGCNRHDAECLGRIGKLVGHQLAQLKPNTGPDSQLGRALPAGYGGSEAKTVDPDKKEK
jgi:hypothetical protein